MGRRKQSGEDVVSLFPFLSILACVIGTLTMMITSLALSQMDVPSAKDAAEIVAAEERLKLFRELQQQITRLEAEIAKLRQFIADAEAQRKKLLAELASLLKVRDQKQTQQKQQKDLLDKKAKEAEDLRKRIEELQKSIAALDKRIAEAQAEVKKRVASKEAVVKLQPSGSGRGLIPLFIECTGRGLAIYDSAEPRRVATAELVAGSPAYLEVLEKMRDKTDSTIVFLIRTDGIGVFQTASRFARERDVRHGKLPVPGQGQLDFTLLQGRSN